jgi:hypothetical protein
VATLYTTDVYGSSLIAKFESFAAELGIKVIASQGFSRHGDPGKSLDLIKDSEARIIGSLILVLSLISSGGISSIGCTNSPQYCQTEADVGTSLCLDRVWILCQYLFISKVLKPG